MKNQRSFEQLLEHCLQKTVHTQDVEAVLRRYPHEANQLRPLLEIALATDRHYANVPEPPGGWRQDDNNCLSQPPANKHETQ